jgi:hypothetical protein
MGDMRRPAWTGDAGRLNARNPIRTRRSRARLDANSRKVRLTL